MDTPSPITFDSPELRDALMACQKLHPNDGIAMRKAAVPHLKAVLAEGRAALEEQLKADGNGRRCASGLSRQMDSLIRCLFLFITGGVYRSGAPSTSEHMAVVATGGYGRSLLAPRSDIDLLFLLPYRQTPWGESVAELLLYFLWDLGLKVGHATRSVDQCLALSRSDMTIRTALLDSRLITGSTPLFADLEKRFRGEVAHNTGRAFIDAKLAERDDRHTKSGESRYKVEPNIKDGKGGIRDLHTLHWLLKYLHGLEPDKEAVAAGLFSDEEFRTFRRCEDFLWTVRCHLHFVANRPEERISFDMQPVLAERMRYRGRGGLLAVERFMKHYFLVAREVGELTLVVCAALEAQQMKAAPRLGSFLSAMGWRARRVIRSRTDFRIENNRLTTNSPEVFNLDPVNLLRFFRVAQEHDLMVQPDAIRLIRQSLRLITDKVRNDPEANRVFLEILTAPAGVERVLRRMTEAGVLGRFIPEFGACIAMMQFNMYHSYTVDEHLLMSVGLLAEIEAGTLGDDHPLATKIVHQIQNRRALYVAVLLHDVGKRLAGDHSLTGAAIARQLCPRLGLTKSETDLVAWLIEWHLVMSSYAQSRDINDPKTIRDFADIVQSPERLRLLLVLTVADIRAVGPGVWNGWKGQLLRNLYTETELVLSGGHAEAGRKERIAAAKTALKDELKDWPVEQVERVIARHQPAYWLTTNASHHADHARLLRKAATEDRKVAWAVHSDAFTAVTELTVLAPDVPRLLAMMAGACAGAGADIMGAHVCTTMDGFALDTFQLRREMDTDSEERRAARIGEVIGKLIAGDVTLEKVMERKVRPQPRLKAFSIEPDVSISNSLSDRLTVVEVNGLDRPGLLYEVTAALSDLGLDIHSAHISTFGERAVDVFYVTAAGAKVASSERQAEIRATLTGVMAGPGA